MLVDLGMQFVDWNKVELESINWSSVGLSGELLQESSSETSWIGESTNPEAEWKSLLSPKSKELISIVKITEPVGKWLQGEVSERPGSWNLVLIQTANDLFKIWGDKHQTLNTLLKLVQVFSQFLQKYVVSSNFLQKHNTKWGLVISKLVLKSSNIDELWNLILQLSD